MGWGETVAILLYEGFFARTYLIIAVQKCMFLL